MASSAMPPFAALEGGVPDIPIAVVGIGCRFSGTASDPEKYWDLLASCRSTSTLVPKDRFNAEAFFHPDFDHAGTCTTKSSHFITGDISEFDAPFFSITAIEAKSMDPQQRLALEVAYEAFENGKQLPHMLHTLCM